MTDKKDNRIKTASYMKRMFSVHEIRLKEKNIRPTAMRILVLETLNSEKRAISLTTIEKLFEKSDRITLYRTLKTFQEKGLVHSINDGTGATKFALCEEGCRCDIENDLHVHFHCRICSETFCLPKNRIPDVELPAHFKPDEINLLVKGTCPLCINSTDN